jgi:hypothetical protein
MKFCIIYSSLIRVYLLHYFHNYMRINYKHRNIVRMVSEAEFTSTISTATLSGWYLRQSLSQLKTVVNLLHI